MKDKPQTAISMVITNVHLLDAGVSPQCTFYDEGGVIGAGSMNAWFLKDTHEEIKENHCEIIKFDGAFCVKDLCGKTFVNSSSMPIGLNKLAKLQQRDTLTIGPYQIRVLFGELTQEQMLADSSLEQLFNKEGSELIDGGGEPLLISDNEEAINCDPLGALDRLAGKQSKQESLLSDDHDLQSTEQLEDSSLLEESEYESKLEFTPQADSDYEMTSSMRLKNILGFGKKKKKTNKKKTSKEKTNTTKQLQVERSQTNVSEGLEMDDKVLDLLEEEVAKTYGEESASQSQQPASNYSTESSSHLLTGPMLTGLGVQIGGSGDMARLHLLSEDIGESLQSCIKGLLALNTDVGNGRFGVINRNLQPIEDNPLRLGLSYEETVKTMYDTDQSLVHLSASAAISESLQNIRNHNQAMQHATSEALAQILQAFSPEVLLKRFNNYRRKTNYVEESNDSWAWNMYCNYYQELTSNRQQGFEKLFWEIFEQSYDKKIRELQRELSS